MDSPRAFAEETDDAGDDASDAEGSDEADAADAGEGKAPAGDDAGDDEDLDEEEDLDDEDDEEDWDDEDDDDDEDDEDDSDSPEFSWGGKIQSDIRFRVEPATIGSWYDRLELPAGVARNENVLGLKFEGKMGSVKGVADIDFVLLGHPEEVTGFSALAQRDKIDAYRFDIHSLFVEVKGLLVDGLDLRVGQQLVMWGVGDQFNPTNNLNSEDLEDPLRFGDQLGNLMVKLDYWITDEWSMSAVLVPIFKPALLPRSGQLALAALDRLPFTDDFMRYRVHAEQGASENPLGHPTVVSKMNVELPETSFENMQFAFRLGGSVFEQDIALSYYLGRTDIPVPLRNHTHFNDVDQCNPEDSTQCIMGMLETEVTLHYPRMHVYGLNMAGEIPLNEVTSAFKALGYRLEIALVVPERATLQIINDELPLPAYPQPAGEYDYNGNGFPGGPEPEVVADAAFAKWVLGLDYTWCKYLYTNLMWVHGLSDEYGAGDFFHEGYAVRKGSVTSDAADTLACATNKDGTTCAKEVLMPRLNDYLAMVIDFKFLDDQALIRLFTLFQLNGVWIDEWDAGQSKRVREHYHMFTEEGFTAIIYPEFNYNFLNGLELGAGALIQIGEEHTKFGDPAAGGTIIWTRGRYSF